MIAGRGTIRDMDAPRTSQPDPTGELLFRSADVCADLWRRAALAKLEDMVGRAVVAALTDEADEMTVTSVQRGAHYTVVAVSGPLDARAGDSWPGTSTACTAPGRTIWWWTCPGSRGSRSSCST